MHGCSTVEAPFPHDCNERARLRTIQFASAGSSELSQKKNLTKILLVLGPKNRIDFGRLRHKKTIETPYELQIENKLEIVQGSGFAKISV